VTLREQIVQQALTLAPGDRVYVADVLEQSLSDGGFSSAEIAAEWAAEVERRMAAYDRGEVQGNDVEAVVDRLRQQPAEHRARKVMP
jgi:putative addiction module component (TIGR02574 family)